MANNIILTPKVYARLTLMDLGGSLKVARNMSTKITPEFAKKEYKIGDTVEVRKPYRFAGGDGIGWDPEPLVDQVTPISVKQVSKVHFMMDTVERTLEIREAMELYSRPTALSLGAKINSRAATFAANNALSSVGTPGTAPTSEATYLAAGDILVELGLPDDEELTLIVNRRMSSAFVSGVKSLLNPTGALSKQWKTGTMQDSLGYTVVRDQTINTRTNGVFADTPLVNGANQQAEGGNNATMNLVCDGWTSTTLQPGDRFTIGSAGSATVGGVNSVHPQTRQSTGRQQICTVLSTTSDSAGAMAALPIFPALTPSGQYQNVDSSPVDNAIITLIGTTGLTNIQNGLLLHKNAFAFVSVPMWNPPANGVISAQQETDPETGLAISYVQYFDGDNRQAKHRFDSLYDFGNMYREMACAIQA